jgi:integrase
MGRQAKLRQKDGHWATDAGGKTTRFGKVSEITRSEALRRFHAHLANGTAQDDASGNEAPESTITVGDLADRFLGWVLAHRGVKAHRERSRHLKRFRDLFGGVLATSIDGTHVDDFSAALIKARHGIVYVMKHVDSVRAMYNRGIRMGWLPRSLRPLSGVESLRRPANTLTEADLLTDDEVSALLRAAQGQLHDLLRLYHATGARTAELLNVRVADFQRMTRQIVLGNHKRSHTLREPVPRAITLNETAFDIMTRLCEGKGAEDLILPNSKGRAYTNMTVAKPFRQVRSRAGVRGSVTIYSFRHLWISEMLMTGVDVLLVARMAGTSVAMIERVYGHFHNQSYQDAQARLDAERARRRL